MVILRTPLAPKSPMTLSKAQVNDPEEWKKLGYTFKDGKLRRQGRFYISAQMEQIENWCNEHNYAYNWNIKPNGGPFLDGIYLEIQGEIKPESLKSFPVSPIWTQIV